MSPSQSNDWKTVGSRRQMTEGRPLVVVLIDGDGFIVCFQFGMSWQILPDCRSSPTSASVPANREVCKQHAISTISCGIIHNSTFPKVAIFFSRSSCIRKGSRRGCTKTQAKPIPPTMQCTYLSWNLCAVLTNKKRRLVLASWT